MRNQAKRYYRFGPFRVDVTERLLVGQLGAIALTPKAFDTLLALLENRGHVLSKEELMQRVWPDSFVEENNLAQMISVLRKALGEGVGQKFIETVPKRGYRFVAEVRETLGRAEERPGTRPASKMQVGCNEQQNEKGKPSLRDVVIIGRAIDFR